MRRALLLAVLSLSFVLGSPPSATAQAPVKRGSIRYSKTAEWQQGTTRAVQITTNADGELRLADRQIEGVYTSASLQLDFPANALGALWNAEVPAEAELRLEVRGGPTAAQFGDWQPLQASDERSLSNRSDGAATVEAPVPLPPGSQFVEFRATLKAKAQNASPVLDDITLHYFDASAGPALSPGLPRVATPFGAATLTPAPLMIARSDWSGANPTTPADRQVPRAVVLHQIGVDAPDADPLPYLRAVASYQTEVLGWGDLSYHFVIDAAGDIFQGHAGGPAAAIPRFSAGDDAVQVALIGNGAASPAAQEALRGLLAWLGQSFGIAPLGLHSVAVNASTANRQNVVAHSEIAPGVADPSRAFIGQIGAIRQAADQTMVRSRWYFAEGNTFSYLERLSVLNTSSSPANVRFRLLRQPGQTQELTRSVAANGRFDLLLNDVFSDTTDVPAIVESNQAVIVERFMDFRSDITASPGITTPQRVWYFAEGSTDGDFKTYLLLFNPQTSAVDATLTYMKGDGTTAVQQVAIPPLQRSVVVVNNVLPSVGFGTRVIASQPIVAERTMIFGPGSTTDTGGVHSAPGVSTLSQKWYFAEGTTEPPFQMRVLVLNPNAQSANVAITFLNADGVSLTRLYAIPPTSRLAIDANEFVPQLGVATVIESDRLVAAERAMYWRDGAVGTVTAGAPHTAYTWRFADGRTSDGFQEYLLFNNPNKNQARVTAKVILANGTAAQQTVVMPGGSRYTMALHQLYPDQKAISATLQSTQPIIAERSLYPGDPRSAGNRGGATSFGVPEMQP